MDQADMKCQCHGRKRAHVCLPALATVHWGALRRELRSPVQGGQLLVAAGEGRLGALAAGNAVGSGRLRGGEVAPQLRAVPRRRRQPRPVVLQLLRTPLRLLRVRLLSRSR